MDQDPTKRIEEEIRNRYSAGIELEAETMHFIESTFGAASFEALSELLTAADEDNDVLVDLLFSPDQALCCRVEYHLSPEGVLPGQRRRLAARLHQDPLLTRIQSGEGPIRVCLPDDLVEGFLDRLCLDRPLDPALLAAASDRYDETDALQVRFRLREAALPGTEEEKKGLLGLMSARRPDEASFWPLLETLIGFLQNLSPGRDLFHAMADRKQACLRHLRQAAGRIRTLERHNIETILVGGERMPHVDTDALAGEVARIDDLGLILFGRPIPAAADGPIDLGEVSSREDLDRLMHFFTKS